MSKKECGRCGVDLPDDTPAWKKLCFNCWKLSFKGNKNIKFSMVRLGESNTTHNLSKKW